MAGADGGVQRQRPGDGVSGPVIDKETEKAVENHHIVVRVVNQHVLMGGGFGVGVGDRQAG